ncbi:MAG: LCP family protein, partial [Erysipelotrichaceae bacterium]|nr:LCP family protein [Erysipelotrichaceae bacterium]
AWKNNRSDVNHLLVVNPEKKHILIISIPRDTRIENVATGYYDKFTHFCQNGPMNPSQSIGKVLDIEIPYYCMTSFTWFVKGINYLGGVTVAVPMDGHLDMDSNRDVSNPQHFEKGTYQLWGETALALARNRKYDGIVNNDMGRIRNQALIIDSLISKIASHPYLLEMVGMDWLMDYLCENNFSDQEKKTLFALAQTFADGYTIDNFFLDGEPAYIDEIYYVIPDEDNIEIAKGKIELVMTGKADKADPYYEEIMKGYITGGCGTEADGNNGYIGTYYDLSEVFGE